MTWSGAKGKGGGTSVAAATYEAPNTLQSKSTAKILDLLCEGEIGGLVDGAKSIFFDGVPLENPDGTRNFSGVTYEERYGLPDQDPISGFPSAETEAAVGLEVTNSGGPVVRTISDPDADAVRVKIRIPNLSNLSVVHNALLGYTVGFTIEIAPNGGGYTTAVTDTIQGKTVTNYEREYRIELPSGGSPWSVRVTRTSGDDATSNLQSKTFWSSYTVVTDAKLSYPDSAMIFLQVDSEQFGTSVPTRGFLIRGRKIEVPSNYDVSDRSYTGIWDGTFQYAISDNPAWIFRDMVLNDRFGLGKFVQLTAAAADKWGLYGIAQYNDGLVSDGAGGLEPRFTFNGVIQTEVDAYQLLNSLASVCRSMSYWSTGSVSLTQDAPADPVRLVAPANVIGGAFHNQGSSLKTRFTSVFVTWNDPALGYKDNIEYVDDPELIARYGIREKSVVAFGCTSRGQARRLGRWIIETSCRETRTVSWTASMDQADLLPGDIVAVHDPAVAQVRFGGRIAEVVSSTEFELDGEVTLSPGETYKLRVILPSGDTEERVVVTGASTTTTLEVASAFTEDPLQWGMWSLSGVSVEPQLVRIVTNEETDPNKYAISGVRTDPGKFARVEQALRVEPPSYSAIPSGAIPAPLNLAVEETIVSVAGTLQAVATFSWSPSSDGRVRYFEAEVQRPGSSGYESLGSGSSVTVDLGNVVEGEYSFRVRASTSLGQKSPYTTLDTTLFAFKAPPEDVASGQVQVLGDQILYTWQQVPDLDVLRYEIRHHPSAVSPTWGAGTFLTRVPASASSAVLPSLAGTYMIKAVDTSGVESENSFDAVSPIDISEDLYQVDLLTEDPSFSGTRTDMVVSGSDLKLDAGSGVPFVLEGIYEFNGGPVDLGAKYRVVLTPTVEYTIIDGTTAIGDWPSLSAVVAMSGAEPSSVDVEFQVAVTDDDPSGTPTWSAWKSVVGYAEMDGRGFKFRIVATSTDGTASPLISSLVAEVSLRNRVAFGDDVDSAPGGSSIAFDFEFYATPAITVTGQGLSAGDTALVTNQASTGFDIQFVDSGGSGITTTFDYIAQGPGRKLA